MSEFVTRFATSSERVEILKGLKSFRDALRRLGFQEGFQWVDGSFVEECELVKGRPPGDVDVVSVLHRPPANADDASWAAFVDQNFDAFFDPQRCKATYLCDAYFIDLDAPPRVVSERAAYWFGLFSHQRDTFRWKGLVQLDLHSDDEAAMHLLAEIEARW